MSKILGSALLLLVFVNQSHSKDKGIGILFLVQNSSTNDTPRPDTVCIYKEMSSKSLVLDRFFINPKNRFDVLVQSVDEQAQLLEFDYETLGLPILEVRNKWVKVIFGSDKSGKPLIGWVVSVQGITNYYLWENHLKQKQLFFESPDKISFFHKRDGAKVDFQLAPSQYLKYDYIMRPLEVQKNWMKVEVTTPSDNCNKPEKKETKVFWIKYLDERGRPLVWYFTRGC